MFLGRRPLRQEHKSSTSMQHFKFLSGDACVLHVCIYVLQLSNQLSDTIFSSYATSDAHSLLSVNFFFSIFVFKNWKHRSLIFIFVGHLDIVESQEMNKWTAAKEDYHIIIIKWTNEWGQCTNNKLYKINPIVG